MEMTIMKSLKDPGSVKTVPFDQENIFNHTWSPIIFDGYRNTKSFKQCNFAVADIDGGMTVESATAKLNDWGFSYILATSQNHQKEKKGSKPCDRFRIIIPLENPITDQTDYIKMQQQLFLIFPKLDTGAQNRAQGFKPCTKYVYYDELDNGTGWKPDLGKGLLSNATKDFIKNKAVKGERHTALVKASFDFKSQGYSEGEFINIASDIDPIYVDDSSLEAIDNCFSQESLTPPRAVGIVNPDIYDPKHGIKLLGCKGNNFFYSVKETKEVIALRASEHGPRNLQALCPLDYWKEFFGYEDKDGLMQLDYDLLFSEQRKIGAFTEDRIRGFGCWKDRDRIIINMDKKIIVDGKKLEFEEDFKTKYHYENKGSKDIDLSKTVTEEELEEIKEIFELFKYKNEDDKYYLLGALLYFQVFNLLDWKPNLWLIGERGCGKSQIQKFLRDKFFSHYSDGIVQDTTAAGVKQFLGSDSRIMFMDEMESDNVKTQRRLSEVLEMIRQSTSGSATRSLRGTAGGTSSSVVLNSAFVLSSIKHMMPSTADETRWKIIEMVKNDKILWKDLRNKMEGVSWDTGLKLFGFGLKNINIYKELIGKCHDYLSEHSKIESRLADTISPFVAGYLVMFPNELKLEELCVKMLGSFLYDDIEDLAMDDAENCLEIILGSRTNTQYRETVLEVINEVIKRGPGFEDPDNGGPTAKVLARMGIRYLSDEGVLAIHVNSMDVKGLLSDTNFNGKYSTILRRHKYCIDKKPVQIFEKLYKCLIFDKKCLK